LRDIPIREQKKRIGEVIEKLGLKGREKQIIRSLSKGYKQRVGLAQAILHNPDLLVLDEPTSGLDPKQIIEIRQLISELGKNHTVLLSTHILPEVSAICNRVLIIHQGRIVLDEHPDHISENMVDKFELTLKVKGPREEVVRLVRSIPAVSKVKEIEREAGSDASATRLRITTKNRADIREELFYRLAERRLPILEMKTENMSLEDIFLKLTTDEQAAFEDEPEVETDA
jgi:ABC-2 type transport system ATP-binding protein